MIEGKRLLLLCLLIFLDRYFGCDEWTAYIYTCKYCSPIGPGADAKYILYDIHDANYAEYYEKIVKIATQGKFTQAGLPLIGFFRGNSLEIITIGWAHDIGRSFLPKEIWWKGLEKIDGERAVRVYIYPSKEPTFIVDQESIRILEKLFTQEINPVTERENNIFLTHLVSDLLLLSLLIILLILCKYISRI